MKSYRLPFVASLCLVFAIAPASANGQQPQARARIVAPVDDAQVITLRGNTHPLARPQFDRGPAPDDLPARRMLLLLSRTPEQQAALDSFVEAQHTPGSPNYRQWLTPAEFGMKFGPADSDVQAVTGWLQRQGFSIGRISGGNTVVEFSGTAGQVKHAFHTELHKYLVKGEEHWANAQDPQIPAALAPVVRGLVSLNNFHPKPMLRQGGIFTRDANGNVIPAYTVTSSSSGTQFYGMGPADFATIYGSNQLLQAGNNGTGETIAVLGVSNIQFNDVTTFRSFFGLPTISPIRVEPDGPDPGLVPGAETEADLDVEWASAVAPGASVVLVPAESTETTRGTDLAALHVIENNLADVINLSFSECEANLGASGTQFFKSLWQQAAAQGITVVVSTGDDGSAGCDDQDIEQTATQGLGVNGFASTAYNIAVGGTDFNDVGTQTTYWNSANTPPNWQSVKSYIPEIPWNDSCAASATAANLATCGGVASSASNIVGGSGGVSAFNAKPSWQSGPGVPSDGFRDIPDVSFFAAVGTQSRSFYVVCEADVLPAGASSCQHGSSVFFLGVGGTSASAPSFAGIVALAAQKAGTRLGNVNYFLYSMAAGSGASCASTSGSPSAGCIFNDITSGNISVPCNGGSANCSSTTAGTTGVLVSGSSPAYMTTRGYDLATGLGSLNVTNFANALLAAKPAATTTTTLTLNSSTAGPISMSHGTPINIGVNVASSNSTEPTGDVSVIGGAGGVTFQPLDASGAAAWSSPLFPGGNYSVKAHYAGDGAHQASDSNAVSLNITPENSNTFVNLVSFDVATQIVNFTASSVPYGSPYILRVDVTNSAGSVSSSTGVNSTCSAKTASCPTGNTTITANSALLDGGNFPLNSQGYTEDQPIQLSAGSYTIAASYAGDASYNSSSGTKSVTITKAQTSLSVTSPPSTAFQYGTPAQINAVVSTTSSGVNPTGTFAFTDNSSAISPVPISFRPQPGGINGYASWTEQASYVPASVGVHNLAAQYAGDSNYLGSNTAAPLSLSVMKAGISLSSATVPAATAPNAPVTIMATMLSPSVLTAPIGAVTFTDNGSPITSTPTITLINGGGSSSAGFTAQMPVTFAQTGTHALSLSYAGDANYNATTQAIGTVNVTTTPLSITLPAGGNQVTMPASGGSGTASIGIVNSTSAAMNVSLACKADSTAATCSATPAAVSVVANGTATANVNYTVPALTGMVRHNLPFGLPFIFAGVLLGVVRLNRRKRAVGVMLLALVLLLGVSSCGGGSSPAGHTITTPSPKVYNFTVTATSGSNSDSKTITVTVQ